jgi:hypothetical protein
VNRRGPVTLSLQLHEQFEKPRGLRIATLAGFRVSDPRAENPLVTRRRFIIEGKLGLHSASPPFGDFFVDAG